MNYLTDIEQLEQIALDLGLEVIEYPFVSKRIKGLCYDKVIALNEGLDRKEKNCVLAEEIGHYKTNVSNILNQEKLENRKEEEKARRWAYENRVTFEKIINAYEQNLTNRFEIAEFLNVTEEFLQDALTYYKKKYPQPIVMDNYMIRFCPELYVVKFFV